ncbi:DUF4034 domain-containing protein [Pseudomonas xanthosomatis]|uniref:DUF4034 domain-containing protein n=1 Tax=Pseudomonas xanthosomatis TaxID=2842356 RepID=UPI003515DBB2
MQLFSSTRQHLRELAQARAFNELTAFCEDLENQWQQAAPGEVPVYSEVIEGHMLIDWDHQIGKDLTRVLKGWIEACPGSYHAHLVMGMHAFDRATFIRTFNVASEVTQERWLGAAQACELAAVHLLKAMQLSPRPVAAAICLIKICAHFNEPGWLHELFQGKPASYRPGEHADEEALATARGYLERYELAAPAEVPQVLPAILPPREAHQFERPQDYWLLCAMQWMPNCFEAVETHAAYLKPRWGGSYDDIDGLADGPLTASWSEAQRNAIRWLIFEDQIELPKAEDSEEVAAWQEVFDYWKPLELRPLERATLLAWEGAFQRYSLNNHPEAMQCYSQSVALYPGEGWVGNLGDPFWSLVYISLYDPQPDPQNTFKNAIERLSALSNYAAACALRAAGHQFGVWGFERSPELAEQWLQTAAKRQNGREGFGFDLEEIPRMIWHAGLHPVACFLWQRLADLGRVDAASALYDVHRGWFNDTPEQYIDAHKADYWLKRSAEAGCKVSKYNLARDRMNNEDMHDPVARVEVWKLLIDAMGEDQTDGHAKVQLGILLRRYGEPVDHELGLRYLLSVFDHSHDWVAGRACAEIALAWLEGRGAPRKNRFAAMQWATRGHQINEDSEEIIEIAERVYNSHNRLLSIFTAIKAFLTQGKFVPGELPPAPEAR